MIYELNDNTSYERKWTTAVSIQARSRMIEWSCPDCGTATSYPAGSFDTTVEGGTAYPDILGCGAFPLLIVSERVVASWRTHNIGTFVTFPVGVAAALETTLLPTAAPQYFRIEVVGDAKVDIRGSGGKVTKLCSRCGNLSTQPMVIRKFAFLRHSWDGSALFRDQRLYPTVVFCTEEVKRLAEAEKHTNFRFEEMLPVSEA